MIPESEKRQKKKSASAWGWHHSHRFRPFPRWRRHKPWKQKYNIVTGQIRTCQQIKISFTLKWKSTDGTPPDPSELRSAFGAWFVTKAGKSKRIYCKHAIVKNYLPPQGNLKVPKDLNQNGLIHRELETWPDWSCKKVGENKVKSVECSLNQIVVWFKVLMSEAFPPLRTQPWW